jgi:RNA-directed DNA polymerase
MQAKLHRLAAADPGRRFDDLFNFVHDPATLLSAYIRVAGNRGANTPGVDGMTVRLVEERISVREFLDDLCAQLKEGTFRPLPVRKRMIPKPGGSGKLRKVSIPAVADKLVQAALKLVLEPIFEADFEPFSYGFPAGAAGRTTRSPRFTSSAPADTDGCLTPTSRRPSTTSRIRLSWAGYGPGSRTSACSRW